MSHLLLDTRDQYLSSSFCAPSTLSTTSSLLVCQPKISMLSWPGYTYVFASIRWIISDCSLTMAASCPKLQELGQRGGLKSVTSDCFTHIDPSSLMVDSIASMACPRC